MEEDSNQARISSQLPGQLVLERFQLLAEAMRPLAEAMRPHAEAMQQLAADERVALEIGKFGLVPHDRLWPHFENGANVAKEQDARSGSLAVDKIWPSLRPQLCFKQKPILADDRLSIVYEQMLDAHQLCLYEAVKSLSVTAIERTVALTKLPTDVKKTQQWLETEIGKLPLTALGGIRGLRMWRIIRENVFSTCGHDRKADAIQYMNRHAVAHGWGSIVATSIDSLNAILLTHFVISSAIEVGSFRNC